MSLIRRISLALLLLVGSVSSVSAQNVLINLCGGSDTCFGTGNARDAIVVTDGAKRIRFKFDGTEITPETTAVTSLGTSARQFKDAQFSGTVTAGTFSGVFSGSGAFTFINVDHGAVIVNTQPTIDATVTWNEAATTFTGLKFVVTDTTSAAGSKFADFLVGATSQWSVSKAGASTQIGAGTVTRAALGVTSTDGLVLQNTTDAAAGAQQISPRLRFSGEGWKTDATAASQITDFKIEALPVEGAAAPTVNLILAASINGGAYSTVNTFTSAGAQTLVGALSAAGVTSTASVRANTTYTLNGVVLDSVTAPTIASGFGTSPSVPAANGTAAFTVDVGTGGTATAGVITMPAATTGWICTVENRTGVLANRADQRTMQIATTTTSVTVENQKISDGTVLAWTASDVLTLSCRAY